jgi:hypothetical protein
MIAVIVTFTSSDGFEPEQLRGIADNSSGKFEGLHGLRSKVFSVDADRRRARNVYLWDDEAKARDFFDDDLKALVTKLYGVAPTIDFVDVVGYVDNAH